jgi:hypothetical protein
VKGGGWIGFAIIIWAMLAFALIIWWTEDPADRRPLLPRVEREK